MRHARHKFVWDVGTLEKFDPNQLRDKDGKWKEQGLLTNTQSSVKELKSGFTPPPRKGKPVPVIRLDKAFDPNQPRDEGGKWTASGGGGSSVSATGRVRALSEQVRKEFGLRRGVFSVAKDLPVPRSSAHYHNGKITLRESWVDAADRKLLLGVMRHEAMHAKLQKWTGYEGPHVIAGLLSSKLQQAGYSLEELAKYGPGTSQYADEYWQQWESVRSESTAGFSAGRLAAHEKVATWLLETAVHETLAEMAKAPQESYYAKAWRRLYREVRDA